MAQAFWDWFEPGNGTLIIDSMFEIMLRREANRRVLGKRFLKSTKKEVES